MYFLSSASKIEGNDRLIESFKKHWKRFGHLKFPAYTFAARLETREIIIKKSLEIFKQLGIKSVSMDDLAREMGMSKKTLYLHFKDKRDLVNQTFDHDMEMDKNACFRAFKESENAVQQMLNISKYVHESIRDMNPAALRDIQKYYPNCWKKFQDFSENFIFNNIKNNMQLGRKQGLYRKDFDIDLVSSIYVTLVKSIADPMFSVHSKHAVGDVHKHIIQYHFHGICTPEGLKYLKQHITT